MDKDGIPNVCLKYDFFVGKIAVLCSEKFGKNFGNRFWGCRFFNGLSPELWL